MDFIFDYVDETVFASILLFGLFFLMLAQGIAISVAIAGVIHRHRPVLYAAEGRLLRRHAKRCLRGVDSFTLLAIPFFILAGNIMNKGGIAIRLVNLAKLIGGRLPGSLAHTNVIANMLFGSISGSAIAAAAAVGGTMAPLQKKEGLRPDLLGCGQHCLGAVGHPDPAKRPLDPVLAGLRRHLDFGTFHRRLCARPAHGPSRS